MITSRSFLLGMRNVTGKVVQKIKTHLVFNNFHYENPAVYEIMWEQTAEWDGTQMTIGCMRNSFGLPKATDTHSEYVILIPFR
jgi:hypothetical protein